MFETLAIPAEFLSVKQAVAIPEGLTYGDALKLWAEDRKTIADLFGNIEAIRLLQED